jgi:DNA-binding transcriptional LysR family regulator
MNPINISAMDLNLLKVFEALYEEGGASRAAVRLGLTQSSVSAALARLRALYEDPLFLRRGRGLAPSPRADELKPILSEALDRCRQSLLLAADPGERVKRMIAIGLSDDFEMAIGRAVVRAVGQRNRGIPRSCRCATPSPPVWNPSSALIRNRCPARPARSGPGRPRTCGP